MQRLEPSTRQKLMEADDSQIRTAVERIRSIDYKTVSIVDLENTLNDCYDPLRTYTITYPDGSTK